MNMETNMQYLETDAQRGITIVEQPPGAMTLAVLIDRAVKALAEAKTAAEVLEARDMASVAYDMAKNAARLGKAKQAHDELIAAAHRAQADALIIESLAKERLADEYDAAQERGDVARLGTNQKQLGLPEQKTRPATVEDIGLTHKQVHEARLIRDAETADPGIVRRTVDNAVVAGEEPTKAKVRSAITAVVSGLKPIEPNSKHTVRKHPSDKEIRRAFKERPALKRAREWMSAINDFKYSMHHEEYECEESVEKVRLTAETFWEMLTFVGDDHEELAEILKDAITTLKAILAAKPKPPSHPMQEGPS
jgi:hypothetical protein